MRIHVNVKSPNEMAILIAVTTAMTRSMLIAYRIAGVIQLSRPTRGELAFVLSCKSKYQ